MAFLFTECINAMAPLFVRSAFTFQDCSTSLQYKDDYLKNVKKIKIKWSQEA